ncbi:hypothetical protein [Hymenobacter sp. GOD-10R]|uniref:hypothetical protein n=1 Tax=Hymenobacter sp. GOD-10R TaxID=3093922 RepID=UPI002D77FFE5|nr:hypothetical protein [Hymenobacter sp. GOD-10R]WRQ31894.1 hypothetical protein SD425_29100 [Hymenobacter sp. GOD-10R]
MSLLSSPLRLGELDIASPYDILYQAGELLARRNARGELFLRGFLAEVVVTLTFCQWQVSLPQYNRYVAPQRFTPQEAAEQFADLDGERLQALLGGYGRTAYQLLDPLYPGFTDQLLAQLLPEPLPLVTRPRPAVYDFGRVLQAYGVSLHVDAPEPQLVFAAPTVPRESPTDEELVLACVIVFMAQLNLTPWLAHLAACEPARALTQLLGALARGDLQEPAWGGVIPKLLGSGRAQQRVRERLTSQPWPLSLLLHLFAEVYAAPERLEPIYAQRAPFRLLRTALDQLPAGPPDPPARRGTWIASILDGLDELTVLADAQGNAVASLRFAQMGQLVLQQLPCPADPAQAEAWLARVQAQEHRCSWSTLSPEQPLDKATVWSFGGYAGTVRLATQSFCEAAATWYSQGRVRNQLWSASAHALERLRLGLRLGYALSQQQPLTAAEEQENQRYMLTYLLEHLRQAQQTLLGQLDQIRPPQSALPNWAESMMGPLPESAEHTLWGREVSWRQSVVEALRTYGYGPQVLQRLGELETLLHTQPENVRWEANTSAYWAEEDHVYQDVLADLLWQEYLGLFSARHHEDGTPVIPLPAELTTTAERHAYYEAYLTAHPDEFTPPGVLNLAPTLRSMAECRAEYEFLLDQPTLPGRTQALQELLQEPVMAHLIGRDFTPDPAPQAGRYTLYWRYEPFHQYPEPVGSWGQQLGLHLSRVCLNAARDTGFFFYDLDHNQYILGHVAVVRKQQGRWRLHEEEPRKEDYQQGGN